MRFSILSSQIKKENLAALSLLLFVCVIGSLSGCGAAKEPRELPDISPRRLTYEEGSLWPKEADGLFLFKDTKAKNIGDIITVHIVENVKAENKSSTKKSRKTNLSLNPNLGPGSNSRYGIGAENSFAGAGGNARGGSLKTTLTAMIVDVLNNGNLRIDGVKELRVNDDKQFVRITGIVRPEDISRSNSVVSTNIAEVNVLYEGEGILDNQEPGLIGRFVNWVWPF